MTDDYPTPEGRLPQPGAPRPTGAVFGTQSPLPPPSPLPAAPAPPSLPAPPLSSTFGARPPTPPSRPVPPATSGSSGNRRSSLIFLVLGAIAVVVALLVFVGLRGGSDEAAASSTGDDLRSEPFAEDEVPESDTESDGPSSFVDPFRPDSVAIDGSSVWVTDSACGVVVRIDKATEEILGAVNVGGPASGVAVAAGSVWVGTRDGSSVIRIDTARMVVGGTVALPGFALGLTALGNDVWATDPVLGVVYRIDAARAELVETVQVGASPHHVAIGDRTVWVTNKDDDTVTMISRGRTPATDVPVGFQPLHVELGAGSAWVTDSADGAVRRLNETTGEVEAVIEVGVWPHALAFANGAVWVGTETGSFWKIDPASNSASRVEDANFASIDTAVDGNTIWVADASGGTVVRFDAGSGTVTSVIDLNELGDCATFMDEAIDPPTDRSL